MPTPLEWLAASQANTGTAATGSQLSPQIIGLSNGNILVAWEEDFGGLVGTGDGTDIIGKIFSADGTLVRDSFVLNQGRINDYEQDFSIAATNDGGYVIAYIDFDISSPTNTDLVFERHNALGTQTAFRTVFSETSATVSILEPSVAVNLNDNSFLVTWTRTTAGNADVRGRHFSAANVGGTEFAAGQSGPDADNESDTAILTNGNYVTVYEEVDAGIIGVEFKINTSAGVFVADSNVSTGVNLDPRVASLANGNFVVVWTDTDVGNQDVRYQVFTAVGTSVAGPLNAASGTDTQNEQVVVALPDGGFVIVWDNDTDGTLEARAFTASGLADGGTVIISTQGATRPDISVTGDGRVLFAWQTEGDQEIFWSIWDPRGGQIDLADYNQNLPNILETTVVRPGPGATADTIIGSNGSDTLFGGGGVNTLFGNDGDDQLFDGAGASSLFGGAGNDDTLFGSGGADFMDGGTGARDTARYAASPSGVNVNLLTGIGAGGDAAGDTYVGIEKVTGSIAADTLTGNASDNTLEGGNGNDTLTGGDGNDVLIGGDNDDLFMVGGTTSFLESDVSFGGNGNDTFRFSDASAFGDVFGGSGTDFLDATGMVNFNIAVDLLLERYFDAAPFDLEGIENVSGSQQADSIGGDNSGNILDGQAGNDTISGLGGNDRLIGGTGSDILLGGRNDDVYVADRFDTIIEQGNEGTDTVQISDTFTLSANIENLTLTGTASINGTGNASDNRITGNSGNNVLNGGGGTDVMLGGLGNDTYVTDGGDTMTESAGQGKDTVRSSVGLTLGANFENLILTGAAAINGTGNGGANSLTGNSGNNLLNGLGGADVLAGGTGADRFVFSTALGAGNIDRITDFNVAADTIRLENAIFTGLKGGVLKASAFARNASGNATDGKDRIIYETDTGKLFFDKDGKGGVAKVHFATLDDDLGVTRSDFFVF